MENPTYIGLLNFIFILLILISTSLLSTILQPRKFAPCGPDHLLCLIFHLTGMIASSNVFGVPPTTLVKLMVISLF